MQRVLFVISSIVVLGVGAIFYIKSDARPLSDDTVFPYVSSSADEVDVYKISNIQAVSDQVVYKNKTQSDKVVHKNNSIQAISDKVDGYKSSNNQVVSDKVDKIVYKNKTQSDKVDVYKSSNNQAVSDKVDQVDVYKNNSGLPSSTNRKTICKSSTSYDHLSLAPRFTLPIRMDTKWVCDLYHEVKQMQSKQLTLLICSESYLEVLVNWLAQAVLHAHYPVENILIIAFDSFTQRVMHHKGIHSVFISTDAIFNSKVNNIANRIWMTRLTVIRLLNHWNYSVLSFDTDALMLKNVQPLLDKFSTSDIVASSGTYPFECSKKWSAPTMCMGAIFYKSSPATGSFVI